MEPIAIFPILHHSFGIVLSVLILYASYHAIKSFKLVIWRKGWYIVGLGAFIFMLIELWELLKTAAYIKESTQLTILMHTMHIIAFLLIAIGIFLLANSAHKIWRK